MRKKINNLLFSIGLAAVIVMLCTFEVSFAELWSYITRAGYWLAAILGLWVVLYLMNAWAWRVIILGSGPCPISFFRLLKLTISGFALNYATPIGLLGGEPYRIMELSKYIDVRRATSSVVLFAMMHIFCHFWFWATGIVTYLALAAAGKVPLETGTVVVLVFIGLFCWAGIYLFMKGYKNGMAVRFIHWLGHLPGLKKWGAHFIAAHEEDLEKIDRQITELQGQNKRSFFGSFCLEYVGRLCQSFEIFFMLLLFGIDGDTSQLAAMSGPVALLFVGMILIFYGYNTMQRLQDLRTVIMSSLVGRTTSIIFLLISVFIVISMAVYSVMEIGDLYLRNNWLRGVYFMSAMVWPVIMALELYQVGTVIERLMAKKEIGLSVIFSCLGLASLGLVVFGVLDIMMSYMGIGYGLNIGVVEVIGGIAVSIVSNFLKGRVKDTYAEAVPDEVLRLGAAVRGDTRRHGLLPRGRRADRPCPEGGHRELRPRGPRRAGGHLRGFSHRVRGRAVPGGGHRRRTSRRGSFRLGIQRQEAARPGHRPGCRRHGPGRGHAVPAGGQLPRGRDLRSRPRGQCRRREDVGRKVRGTCGPHHPVRPGEDRIGFRRVHRRGQGGLHRPGDGMPQCDPVGVRLRQSDAQGGHRSRREAQEALLGQAHHIVPGRGRGPHGRRQVASRSLSSFPSAIL